MFLSSYHVSSAMFSCLKKQEQTLSRFSLTHWQKTPVGNILILNKLTIFDVWSLSFEKFEINWKDPLKYWKNQSSAWDIFGTRALTQNRYSNFRGLKWNIFIYVETDVSNEDVTIFAQIFIARLTKTEYSENCHIQLVSYTTETNSSFHVR